MLTIATSSAALLSAFDKLLGGGVSGVPGLAPCGGSIPCRSFGSGAHAALRVQIRTSSVRRC